MSGVQFAERAVYFRRRRRKKLGAAAETRATHPPFLPFPPKPVCKVVKKPGGRIMCPQEEPALPMAKTRVVGGRTEKVQCGGACARCCGSTQRGGREERWYEGLSLSIGRRIATHPMLSYKPNQMHVSIQYIHTPHTPTHPHRTHLTQQKKNTETDLRAWVVVRMAACA